MKFLFWSLATTVIALSSNMAQAQSTHKAGGALAYDSSFRIENSSKTIHNASLKLSNSNFETAQRNVASVPKITYTPTNISTLHTPAIRSLASYNYPERRFKTPPVIKTEQVIIKKERIIVPFSCPEGTTEQLDGRCLKVRKIVETIKPIIVPFTCPAGTVAKGNDRCVEPTRKIVKQAPKKVTPRKAKPLPKKVKSSSKKIKSPKILKKSKLKAPNLKAPNLKTPKTVELNCPSGTTRHYSGDSCIPTPKAAEEKSVEKTAPSDTKQEECETKGTTRSKDFLGILTNRLLAGGRDTKPSDCISRQ